MCCCVLWFVLMLSLAGVRCLPCWFVFADCCNCMLAFALFVCVVVLVCGVDCIMLFDACVVLPFDLLCDDLCVCYCYVLCCVVM